MPSRRLWWQLAVFNPRVTENIDEQFCPLDYVYFNLRITENMNTSFRTGLLPSFNLNVYRERM